MRWFRIYAFGKPDRKDVFVVRPPEQIPARKAVASFQATAAM